MTDDATDPQAGRDRALELPSWLWIGVPPGIVVLIVGAKLIGEDVYDRWIRSEWGAIENLTVLYLAIAVVTGVLVLRRRRQLPSVWLARWYALLTLGCFYFLGEEASWGQHWFGWETPEGFAELNDQRETNLHNLGAPDWLLDNLPRNLLSGLAVLGGILIPLRWRGRRRWPASDPKDWLWPTVVCIPAAIVASVVRIPTRVAEAAGEELPRVIDFSPGETEEYALAAMLMIYFLSIHRRLARRAAGG